MLKKEIEKKKYFIKDESLKNVDGDKFNHKDFSKLLKTIIDTTEPPYNIAVIGKWGLGKSSLINMAINNYRKQGDKYIVHEINAWKYEKEALTKVFLKKLWEEIDGDEVKYFEKIRIHYAKLITKIRESNEEETLPNKWMIFSKYLIIGLSCFIVGLLAYITYKSFLQYTGFFNKNLWAVETLNYFKFFSTKLLLPVLLLIANIYLAQLLRTEKRNIAFNIDIKNNEEYEALLEEKLKEKTKKYEDFKVITVIDDLDRLSIEKIVEALDTLKAFVGLKNCIFIVPFDDSILKKAIEKRRLNKLQTANEIIESELILDKLFQYKIYLPPIIRYDIKDYAINLLREQASDFLSDYCDIQKMENLVKTVLIHSGVGTPRQVKKILNIFIGNFIVAKEREILNKVEEEILTSNSAIRQIAKISVLQADFNEFYDLLFKSFSYLGEIENLYKRSPKKDEIPDDILGYFKLKYNSETYEIKKEHKELMDFLMWTSKYSIDHFGKYMFLAQETISKKLGDANFREFSNSIDSNNIVHVNEMLETKPENGEIFIYKIENSFEEDIKIVLEMGINVYHLIEKQLLISMASTITRKFEEMRSIEIKLTFYQLSPINVLNIYHNSIEKDFGKNLVIDFLTALIENKNKTSDYYIDVIELFVENDYLFDINIQKLIMDLVSVSLNDEKININDIMHKFSKYEAERINHNRYFGLALYNRVAKELVKNNLFEKEIVDLFVRLFKNLVVTNNSIDKISPIINLFIYPALMVKLNQLMDDATCDNVPGNYATQITDNIIKAEYESKPENVKAAIEIISRLSFTLTSETGQLYDKFFTANIIDQNMSIILVYTGSNSFIQFLPNTISAFIDNILDIDYSSNIVNTIKGYFTKEQATRLVNKIKSSSSYNSINKKKPEKIFEIYKALKDDDSLINDCITYVVNQFNSKYSDQDYHAFVSELMSYMQENVTSQLIEAFLNIIKTTFTNNVNRNIASIQKIQKVISNKQWDTLIPLLFKNVSNSNFSIIYDIIRDNLNYFSIDKENMNMLMDFIIDTIQLADNPNKNLILLDEKFFNIPRIDDLIRECVTTTKIDEAQAIKVLKKLINNMNSEDRVTSIILAAANDDKYNLISKILPEIDSNNSNGIVDEIRTGMSQSTPVIAIYNILDYCVNHKDLVGAKQLLAVADVGFLHDSEFDVVKKICSIMLNLGKRYFSNIKKLTAKTLQLCFSSSRSDDVKKEIVLCASILKIRREFRPLLNEEELIFYNNNIQ